MSYSKREYRIHWAYKASHLCSKRRRTVYSINRESHFGSEVEKSMKLSVSYNKHFANLQKQILRYAAAGFNGWQRVWKLLRPNRFHCQHRAQYMYDRSLAVNERANLSLFLSVLCSHVHFHPISLNTITQFIGIGHMVSRALCVTI